jgi:hypothetical protein
VIHHHPTEFLIPGNRLHGADDHTGSILALLTGHGNVKPFGLPFHNLYPASGGIGYTIMEDRTDKLAKSAAGAFLMIDCKNFTHGFHGLFLSFRYHE